MAWTATLDKVVIDRGNIVPTVTFTSDTGETITQDFRGDDVNADRLASLVARRIASLEARDAAFATLEKLAGTVITPAEPSSDEAAANDFFVQLTKLNNLQASIAKGLTKADDADVAALAATVKASLAEHPEYTSDFRWK